MMTKDLLKFLRHQINDEVQPYLWSDEQLVGFLSEAQEKAARNARLLRDFTTPQVCRINVVTSRQYYDLDKRVIFVRRVTLASRSTPLAKISYRDLDIQQPGWIDRVGKPDRWCTDFESGRLWFNRKPSAADVCRLLVVRLPLDKLSVSKLDAELEIPEPYQRPLHHWAAYRAHSATDVETYDPKRAASHLGAFVAEFGEDSRAIDEEWERQHYGDEDMEAPL